MVRGLNIKELLLSEFVTIFLLGVVCMFYTGYYFTSDDLVFANTIRHLNDPSFLANDITLEPRVRSIYFFKLMAYLSTFLPINFIFFLFYFIKNVLLCGGVYKLSHVLTKDKRVAIISVVMVFYLFSQHIPLSFDILSQSFTFSSLAVAICLFALASFLEKKYILSFLILGLGTNVHFIICSQILLVLLIYSILDWGQVRWKSLFYGTFIYLVLAGPEVINVIILALDNAKETKIPFREFLEIFGYMRGPHHHIPGAWSLEKYLRFAIFTLAGTYSYYNLKRSQELSSGIKVSLIVCGLCLLSVPFIYHSMSVFMYQPFRMTVWIYVIMLIFIVAFLMQTFNQREDVLSIIWSIITLALLNCPYLLCVLFLFKIIYDLNRRPTRTNMVLLILNVALIFILILLRPLQSPVFCFSSQAASLFLAEDYFVLLFIICFGLIKLYFKNRVKISNNINFILLPIVFCLVSLPIARHLAGVKTYFVIKNQPIFVMTRPDSLMDLFSWVKANTDRNDVFIYPPYFGASDFRYFGERAVLADFLTVAFSSNKIKEWYERLDILSNGELSKNWAEIIRAKESSVSADLLKKGYLTLSGNDFRKIASRYNCSYVITESSKLPLDMVYSNTYYKVYKLCPMHQNRRPTDNNVH